MMFQLYEFFWHISIYKCNIIELFYTYLRIGVIIIQ